MKLRLLKLVLVSVFLVSLASLGAIVVFINPYKTTPFLLSIFTLVVFLLVFSSFSWLGFWFRRKFVTKSNMRRILKMSFREGALLGILLAGCLWLNHFSWLKIWTAAPIFILILCVEYFSVIGASKEAKSEVIR